MPELAASQADSLVEDLRLELSHLAAAPVSTWFLTTTDDPANAHVDSGVASWTAVELPYNVTGHSVAWFKTTIVTPEFHFGWHVAGSPLTLVLQARHSAEVYVNGKFHSRIHHGGRVELASKAAPGHVYVVALRVSGPGANAVEVSAGTSGRDIGFRMAALETGAIASVRAAVVDHLDRMDVSSQVTRMAGQGDYVLEQAAREIDRSAIAAGDEAATIASIERANEALSGLDDLFKRYTISLMSNAHIDMAWLWDREETKEVCYNTFRSVLNLMNEYPDFVFSQSQPAAFAWVEEYWPDMFEEIKARVAEGRWELVGGMWVEPDCNLPTGESFVRQVFYGKRYFQEKFGVDVTLGWNPDSFGYNWSMPQVYSKCGINAFLTQKLTWNDTNVWPLRAFWWESPDGSRIYSYFPTSYTGSVLGPDLIRDIAFISGATGYKRTSHLFGIGDHGGGPTREMLDRAIMLKNKKPFPRVQHQRARDFIDTLIAEEHDPGVKVETYNGELYLEYHRGTFTSQAAIKKGNREAEKLLRNAEAFSAIAASSGLPYPGETLERLWKMTLFNQFHDILPGSCIGAAAADAASDYAIIQSEGGAVLDAALSAIAGNLATEADGATVVVANGLNWPRGGMAKIAMDAVGFVPEAEVKVVAPSGNEVASQIADEDGAKVLLFLAEPVPALGVAAYTVLASLPAPVETGVSASKGAIENAYLRVEISPDGTFSKVTDKANGWEALEPGKAGNVLQAFVDNPGKWEAWEIDKDFEAQGEELRGPVDIEVLEAGPVRARIRTTRKWRASTFVQDIILTADAKRVDVVNTVDWQDRRILLKALFPANVKADQAAYEIPFAAIERSTGNETPFEKAQFEVPALQWADLSADGRGAALMNDCKHGYDVKGNRLRLTCLRAPNSPDPKCDRGINVFTYSFFPHAGGWRDGVYREAYDLNNPLIARATPAGSGSAAAAGFVEIGPANVVISALKKAEDGDDWILRFFETAGQQTEAVVTLPAAPAAVWETDMMENNLSEIPVTGQVLRVPLGHNEVKTLRIKR
ncbi:MAG TPA: glycoside hydrolase family 38 C-terminal domain-containing protein [Armatimonadota bacterium]